MTGFPGLTRIYDRHELIADAIVHGIGLAFAVAGTVALAYATAATSARSADLAAALVYGGGLVGALTASYVYNMWPVSPVKWILRRFDHSAIFVLIAATYTPFLVRGPDDLVTNALFVGVWATACAGVVLKCALPGRYDRLAILIYLGLGWSGVIAYPSLIDVLPGTTLALILAGGLVYSAGVVFHVWEKLRFQNAIWHGFVVAGAGIHYAAVFDCLVLAA
jgi:hemolysin III